MMRTSWSLKKDLLSAINALRMGGVIAFPTETVYGLGCDPRNKKAVQKIFRLKGRVANKPLLLVASSLAQVKKIAILNGKAAKMASRYWPGPLTLVLPLKQPLCLAKGVAIRGEVALRVSSSSLVRTLVRQFCFPIVATSANLSGEKESRTAEEVRAVFGYKIDTILDGGTLRSRKTSTVLRVREDGSCELIRDGAIHLPRKLFQCS